MSWVLFWKLILVLLIVVVFVESLTFLVKWFVTKYYKLDNNGKSSDYWDYRDGVIPVLTEDEQEYLKTQKEARDVLKEKFPLVEPAIAKSAVYSYCYARDVLKGKFPLGEPEIAKSAMYSYWYARDVLKGKFPLGEPILKHSNYWKDYCAEFGDNYE